MLANRLREVFGRPAMRQITADRKLASLAQQPTESFTSYIEDVLDLCRRADINMPEHEKVRHLLKGIAEDVFQVILVHSPTTVKKIVEICQQFNELKTQRLSVAATVQRLPEVCIFLCPDINSTSLRELIQHIVREEVSRSLHPTLTSPTSTESALRSLVQTELASSIPSQVPLPLQTMRPTYAEIAAPTFTPNYPAGGMPYVQPFGYSQPRMQSAHQLINSRPVCYYC
ncbi:unnamed protein product [Ixodes pacificus]